MQQKPAFKRILFVCYNITLVNFIKRLLAEKKVPLGENGVEVLHFFELCAKILGEPVEWEKEEAAYYNLVIEEALKKAKDFPEKYDAILVDEGQDFSDDMYRLVVSLLNPATNHLAIALDDNQNIYQRTQTWKGLGIQARGRTHKLSWVYRSTGNITNFANKFLSRTEEKTEAQTPQMELFQEFLTTAGPDPEVKQFPDLNQLINYVAKQIDHLHREEDYPLSEIAVIYTQKSPEHLPGIHLPDLMMKALDKRGICSNWIAGDYRAKRSYDVTTQNVTISTIHSAKGFDYACVFVIGLDWFNPERWSEEQIRNLTYVALTRARERLYIPHVFDILLIKQAVV
jgi:superfamily I DNA/RNA helicase